MQSTSAPMFNNQPSPNTGFMIKVNADPCKYGSNCNRECWSVTKYSQGGEYCKKGEHKIVHWHLAHNAQWTNGVSTIPFNKH